MHLSVVRPLCPCVEFQIGEAADTDGNKTPSDEESIPAPGNQEKVHKYFKCKEMCQTEIRQRNPKIKKTPPRSAAVPWVIVFPNHFGNHTKSDGLESFLNMTHCPFNTHTHTPRLIFYAFVLYIVKVETIWNVFKRTTCDVQIFIECSLMKASSSGCCCFLFSLTRTKSWTIRRRGRRREKRPLLQMHRYDDDYYYYF